MLMKKGGPTTAATRRFAGYGQPRQPIDQPGADEAFRKQRNDFGSYLTYTIQVVSVIAGYPLRKRRGRQVRALDTFFLTTEKSDPLPLTLGRIRTQAR